MRISLCFFECSTAVLVQVGPCALSHGRTAVVGEEVVAGVHCAHFALRKANGGLPREACWPWQGQVPVWYLYRSTRVALSERLALLRPGIRMLHL